VLRPTFARQGVRAASWDDVVCRRVAVTGRTPGVGDHHSKGREIHGSVDLWRDYHHRWVSVDVCAGVLAEMEDEKGKEATGERGRQDRCVDNATRGSRSQSPTTIDE
jgi:hypothetical protein